MGCKYFSLGDNHDTSAESNQSTFDVRSRIKGNNRNDGLDKTNEFTTGARYDPLKWFGVLVPNTLKESQKSFVRALDLAIACANIQMEIDAVIERKTILMGQLDK